MPRKQPSLNIVEMLAYRRPARSKTELEFIGKYLDTIPGISVDQYGNRFLVNPDSRVIISCHTDTVHRVGGKQRIKVKNGIASVPSTSPSNCLGADDTAGIYAALRMIEAGLPLTFIFHRDEEIGGRGSAWLAEHYADWFQRHDICLALDRRGTEDIITEQWGGPCASKDFALSLASRLGMKHSPSDAGIFTDSANYAHLIPECSNLSIGYQHEHTTREVLDLDYLERVITALIGVDWTALEIKRDPLQVEPDVLDWYGFKAEGINGGYGVDDDDLAEYELELELERETNDPYTGYARRK